MRFGVVYHLLLAFRFSEDWWAGGPDLRRQYRPNPDFRLHFSNWGCPRSRAFRDLGNADG